MIRVFRMSLYWTCACMVTIGAASVSNKTALAVGGGKNATLTLGRVFVKGEKSEQPTNQPEDIAALNEIMKRKKLTPSDVLSASITSLGPLLTSSKQVTLLDVCDAVASIGLTLLTTANPILGAVATLFVGYVEGLGGGSTAQTSLMKQMKAEVEVDIEKSMIHNVHENVQGILNVLQNGPNEETNRSFYISINKLIIFTAPNVYHTDACRALSNTASFPPVMDCINWQNQGPLQTALLYAILHVQVLQNMGVIDSSTWAQQVARIHTAGQQYVPKLYDSYRQLLAFRLLHVQEPQIQDHPLSQIAGKDTYGDGTDYFALCALPHSPVVLSELYLFSNCYHNYVAGIRNKMVAVFKDKIDALARITNVSVEPAEILFQWTPICTGMAIPIRAVLAGTTSTDKYGNFVGRLQKDDKFNGGGAAGKVSVDARHKMSRFYYSSDEYQSSSCCAILNVSPNAKAIWFPIANGDPVPYGAVPAGTTPTDGMSPVYVARYKNAAGKINLDLNLNLNNFYSNQHYQPKSGVQILLVSPLTSNEIIV